MLEKMDLRGKDPKFIAVKDFMNRMLNLEVGVQNTLFNVFQNNRNIAIENAKEEGTYDSGVEVIKVTNAEIVNEEIINVEEKSGAETKFLRIKAKTKSPRISLESVKDAFEGEKIEYYLKQSTGEIYVAKNVGTSTDSKTGRVGQRFKMTSVKRSKGQYAMDFQLYDKGKWEPVVEHIAEKEWQKLYDSLDDFANTSFNLISGAILPIYSKIQDVTPSKSLKVQRLVFDDGSNILGMKLTGAETQNLMKKLGVGDISVQEITPKALLDFMLKEDVIGQLNDGTRLKVRRVSGERRLTVDPPTNYWHENMQSGGAMEKMGFQFETIDYTRVAFVPNNENGPIVLGRYMENKLVEWVRDRRSSQDRIDDISSHKEFVSDSKLARDNPKELAKEIQDIVARIAPFVNLEVRQGSISNVPYGADGNVTGYHFQDYSTLKHFIGVALNAPTDPRKIVRHETIHALKEAGMFSDEEWSVLMRNVDKNDLFTKYKVRERYPEFFNGDNPTPLAYEEAIGDDYAEHVFQKTNPSSSIISKVYQRITQFFRDLVRKLRHYGATPSVDSIYDSVESGEVGSRKPNQAKKSRSRGVKKHVEFNNKETEERWKAAAAGVDLSVSGKIRESISDAVRLFTRSWKHIPTDKKNKTKFAQFTEWAYYVSQSSHASKEKIRDYMERVTKGLSPEDLDLLTRKWVLDDLLWTSEQGLDVPFGYVSDKKGTASMKILEDLKEIEKFLDERPDLRERLDFRNEMRDAVTKEMLATGVLTESQAKNPNYFRHQILEYAAVRGKSGSPKGKSKTPFWHKRRGSDKDINVNYFQAETEWLFKAYTDIATNKFLKRMRGSKYNLANDLKKKTRAHNDLMINKKIKGTPLEKVYENKKKAIGIALSFLKNKVEEEYEYLIEVIPPKHKRQLHDFVRTGYVNSLGRDYDQGNGIFRLLDALRTEEMPPAVKRQAEITFASFMGKKKFIKDTLGEDYVDPMNMQGMLNHFYPDTADNYRIWQPDARSAGERAMTLYTAQTLPEHVMDRAMLSLQDTVDEFLTKEQADSIKMMLQDGMRNILALGGPKEQMVLPVEIADTLDQFHDSNVENMLDQIAVELQAKWKMWMLFQPLSLIRYNLNNVTGDVDAILATGTSKEMMGYANTAFREIHQMIYKNELSPEVKEALDMGVIQSSLVTQELENGLIDVTEAFNPKAKADTILSQIKASGKSYFDTVTKATRLRENAFRYAAYLVWRKRVGKSFNMDMMTRQYGYGATPPEVLKGLTDKKEVAARMARDMMGDYGNIPIAAKWARKRLIPFVSWIASNTIRYNNLFRNAYLTAKNVSAEQGIGKGAILAGTLGARMFMVYAFVNIWNNLFFGDQEEELSDESRMRLHLNLGNWGGDSYSMRFQGALSDYLAWFGLEDAGAVLMDHANGRADARDILASMAKAPVNKIAQGITPFYKVPVELFVTGQWFPDVFNPRQIRDKSRHIGASFKLDAPVAWLKKLTGQSAPSDSVWETALQAVVYKQDPGKTAFDNVRSMAYDFLEHETGGGGGFGRGGAKADARYNLRSARAMGDKRSAILAQRELRRLGERRPFRDILQESGPLAMLNRAQKSKFMRTLSAKEKRWVRQAEAWHRKTAYGRN